MGTRPSRTGAALVSLAEWLRAAPLCVTGERSYCGNIADLLLYVHRSEPPIAGE